MYTEPCTQNPKLRERADAHTAGLADLVWRIEFRPNRRRANRLPPPAAWMHAEPDCHPPRPATPPAPAWIQGLDRHESTYDTGLDPARCLTGQQAAALLNIDPRELSFVINNPRAAAGRGWAGMRFRMVADAADPIRIDPATLPVRLPSAGRRAGK